MSKKSAAKRSDVGAMLAAPWPPDERHLSSDATGKISGTSEAMQSAASSAPTVAPALTTLLAEVQESAKYRAVSPDLIRRIGQQELAGKRTLKEAVKATKNRLHQVAGAYFASAPRYADWLRQLAEAKAEGIETFRNACLR